MKHVVIAIGVLFMLLSTSFIGCSKSFAYPENQERGYFAIEYIKQYTTGKYLKHIYWNEGIWIFTRQEKYFEMTQEAFERELANPRGKVIP